MGTGTDKGQAQTVVSLPTTIAVEVNGQTLTAPIKESKAGNFWFEAVQPGSLVDGCNIVDALLASVVSHDGVAMATGKRNTAGTDRIIALSEPRVYEKGHAKAGQVVPGSGGNPTISFVKMLPYGEHGYLLRVTITGREDGAKRSVNVKVQCSGALQGGQARVVGTTTGTPVFGA